MKEEHRQLCLGVLDTLQRLNPEDYKFFPVPALDTLDDDNSNISKSKYRELVKEPRDLGLIRSVSTGQLVSLFTALCAILNFLLNVFSTLLSHRADLRVLGFVCR